MQHAACATSPTLTLTVWLSDGSRFEALSRPGRRVMDLVRGYGFPLKTECAGGCLCPSCHVRVAPAWRNRLPARSAEEVARLGEIGAASDDGSRLVCQLVMSEDLDGLEIELPDDSLMPQACWVAG